MAKLTTLKNRYTKEVVYPVTSVNAVFCQDGIDLETRLINDKQLITSLLSNVVAREVIDSSNLPDIDTYTREELKKDLFIDMWERECRFGDKKNYFGKYNKDTGFFELNEITDITYDEALQIYTRSLHIQIPYNTSQVPLPDLFGGAGNGEYNVYSKCRTYFPIITGGGYTWGKLGALFAGNTIVETLNFVGGYGNSLANFPYLEAMFSGCIKLRKILCPINFPTVNNNTFKECTNLEYINITNYIANQTFNFRWSPKLSIESFKLFVTNARFNSGDPDHNWTLNVIVHPDVYAKLTDESNTEWNQILTDAAAKNITFATV